MREARARVENKVGFFLFIIKHTLSDNLILTVGASYYTTRFSNEREEPTDRLRNKGEGRARGKNHLAKLWTAEPLFSVRRVDPKHGLNSLLSGH